MAAVFLNSAMVVKLTQSLSEVECVKKNPIFTIFVIICGFTITFLATSLSIMTCPFHMDPISTMNAMSAAINMTEYCLSVTQAHQH